MTFIKEFLLAILILSLLTSGLFFYYTNGDPLFFYKSVGWALDPKSNNVVFIEQIKWQEINDASKLKNIFPNITDPPHRKAFLFITEENKQKDTSQIFNKKSYKENLLLNNLNKNTTVNNKLNLTLVCKDGPVLSWHTSDSTKIKKSLKLGKPRGLKQPVANIVLQILVQKPWQHLEDYKPSLPKNWHLTNPFAHEK